MYCTLRQQYDVMYFLLTCFLVYVVQILQSILNQVPDELELRNIQFGSKLDDNACVQRFVSGFIEFFKKYKQRFVCVE